MNVIRQFPFCSTDSILSATRERTPPHGHCRLRQTTKERPAVRQRDGVRILLRLEGFALTVVALALYARAGGTATLFALLFLAPDVSMLFYVFGPRIGAAAYNTAHSTLAPLALVAVSLSAPQPAILPVALIWLAHIGFDRALGYGLKRATGFGDTHLGRIGKAQRAHA